MEPNVNSAGGERRYGNNTSPTGKELYTTFLEWSVLTSKQKHKVGIPTAKVFAEKHDVHESQLSRWKGREDFKQAKADYLKAEWCLMTSDVLQGLYNRCVKYGIASDVELWLAYVEGWDKKQVLEHRQEIKLGPDDIRTIVEFLPEEDKKHFYNTLTDLIAKAETYRNR